MLILSAGRVSSAVFVASLSLAFVQSDRAAKPEIAGTWVSTITVQLPKRSPSKVSMSAQSQREMRDLMKEGTRPTKITTTFELKKNHHFRMPPFGWTGRWSFANGKVTLTPDKYYPALELLYGNQSPQKRVSEIVLTYSKPDHTLRWAFGPDKFKKK